MAMIAVLAASAVSAGADDARDWLRRMNEALQTRNYDGVLLRETTGQGQVVLKILHRVQNGVMAERLQIVSPEEPGARVFTRKGTAWVAYDPVRQIAQFQTRNRSYGFIVAFNGLNDESVRNYTIINRGAVNLDGRIAQRISMEPRDELRYGYRFWLDVKTQMPLKSQVVSRAGEVLETTTFVSINFPDRIEDEQLKPGFDTKGFHWMDGNVPMHTPGMKKAFVPRADLMPAGFSARLFSSPQEEASAKGPRTRFIVSDGIAWVSVFVERADQAPVLSGVMGPRDRARMRPDGVVVTGTSSAFESKRDDYRVIVVGEVPPATVKAIAEAVRSD